MELCGKSESNSALSQPTAWLWKQRTGCSQTYSGLGKASCGCCPVQLQPISQRAIVLPEANTDRGNKEAGASLRFRLTP